MMVSTRRQPQALMSWLDVLADATRLRLLRLLERHELGVAELCNIVQMPQSTVSRHLKLLAEGGWLNQRRNGTANLYRMTLRELEPPAKRLWTLARDQIADTPMFRQDQLRLMRRMQQRQTSATMFFAGAAGRWDKMREQLYGTTFSHTAALALLPSHWTVADLGCGTGHITAVLANHVAAVVGIDQSEAMLRAARKRTATAHNVELRRGNLGALPLGNASCDAALLVLVLTYVTHIRAVLGEAARILRSGGRLVVVDLLRHNDEQFQRQIGQHCLGFEPQQLIALLRQAALTPTRATALPPEPQTKGLDLLLATAVKPETPQTGK